MAVKISASMGIRCLVTSRISSRNYFTDNLGCVIGSEPDRNSDGFKVRNFGKILPMKNEDDEKGQRNRWSS